MWCDSGVRATRGSATVVSSHWIYRMRSIAWTAQQSYNQSAELRLVLLLSSIHVAATPRTLCSVAKSCGPPEESCKEILWAPLCLR